MRTIRYDIETNLPGCIISAPGIVGVCATRGRTMRSIVIVYVDPKFKKDFEKAVESNEHVIAYHADSDGTGKKETAYERV